MNATEDRRSYVTIIPLGRCQECALERIRRVTLEFPPEPEPKPLSLFWRLLGFCTVLWCVFCTIAYTIELIGR